MKKKRTKWQTLWLIIAICIAFVFVSTTLIPSLIPILMTKELRIDTSHILNSDFWMGMSALAVVFIGAFTMIYWYIKEHHMHKD